MQNSTEKLHQLTFTRFLAALSVVFFHSGSNFGVFQIPSILTSGLTAVSYFYVLSGFVMAYVYYRPLTRKLDLSKYIIARFSRIYPVYIFSFIVTCLYYIKIVPKTKLEEMLANLFLYQAWITEYSVSFNITAWSLSVEVFFYILVPLFIIFVSNQVVKRLIWLSLGFWAFSQLVHSILFVGFFPLRIVFLGIFPPFHLNAFLIGFVGGVWFSNRPLGQKDSSFVNLALIIFSLIVVAVALYFRDIEYTFAKTFFLDVGLLAPFFLITILALASDSTWLSKIFSHPWLVLLGDASYALYILHVPFRWWLQRILNRLNISLSSEVFLLIYVPVTIILCVLIYKYIEAPTRDWLRSNSDKLLLIFFDIALIAVMIRLAFALRLGIYDTGFLRTQRFVIFFGTIIFFTLLIVFQVYKVYSWRTLGLALSFGTVILTGLVYYVWQAGWVEGFPRPILVMIPILIFFPLYIYRQTLNRIILSYKGKKHSIV